MIVIKPSLFFALDDKRMSLRPRVYVIGASGNVGYATLKALSENHGEKLEIIAGVRNPDKAGKLKSLRHVIIVKAEMGDEQGLKKEFSGIDALFIVTPGCKNRADLANRTANLAKEARVKHLMIVSVIIAPLAYSDDTSFTAEQFSNIENHVKHLGLAYTILRLPAFYDAMFGFRGMIKTTSNVSLALEEDATYAAISCIDIGKASAEILVNLAEHQNKTYSLLGERASPNIICKAFSNVLGKDIKYEKISFEAFQEKLQNIGLQDWQIEAILCNYRQTNARNPVIRMEGQSGDYQFITGQEPMSIVEWIQHFSSFYQ